MSHLKRRRVVHHCGLFTNGGRNRLSAVAGVDAPKSRRSIQDVTAIGGGVVHVFGADEHARGAFEGTVRREWHPQLFERRKGGGGSRRGGSVERFGSHGVSRWGGTWS